MCSKVVAAILALAVLVVPRQASVAQSNSVHLLRGIKSFDIVLDVSQNRCGVSQDDIKTSVIFVLSQSRMRILKESRGSSSWLDLTVNITDNCNAADVYIYAYSYATVTTNGEHDYVALWRSGAILSGSDNLRQRVLDEVAARAKALVVAWSSANSA